jgi:hypothetical protein
MDSETEKRRARDDLTSALRRAPINIEFIQDTRRFKELHKKASSVINNSRSSWQAISTARDQLRPYLP